MGQINRSSIPASSSLSVGGSYRFLVALAAGGIYTVPAGKVAKLLAWNTTADGSSLGFLCAGIMYCYSANSAFYGACTGVRLIPVANTSTQNVYSYVGVNSGALAAPAAAQFLLVEGPQIHILSAGQKITQNATTAGSYLIELVDA